MFDKTVFSVRCKRQEPVIRTRTLKYAEPLPFGAISKPCWKTWKRAWCRAPHSWSRISKSCASFLTMQLTGGCSGKGRMRSSWKGNLTRPRRFFPCTRIRSTTAIKSPPIINRCSRWEHCLYVDTIWLEEEDTQDSWQAPTIRRPPGPACTPSCGASSAPFLMAANLH